MGGKHSSQWHHISFHRTNLGYLILELNALELNVL